MIDAKHYWISEQRSTPIIQYLKRFSQNGPNSLSQTHPLLLNQIIQR